MNQLQLQANFLKAEVQRLSEQNKDLIDRLNEKDLMDRLLVHALGGASARISDAKEAAQYAIDAVNSTLALLTGVTDDNNVAGPTDAVSPLSG